MLKIGLLGYGKMGKAIESLASQHGTEIVWRISRENLADREPALLRRADVVIEFSRPGAAFDNVMACLNAGVPVISGTTGWSSDLPEAGRACTALNGAMIWASNFSIGVNLFFAVNRRLSELMSQRTEYSPSITEIHHIHKLDAPSGTAITLAQDLEYCSGRFEGHYLDSNPPLSAENLIPITAIREGEVPGTHIIQWQSAVDEIVIEHKANARTGFASGALTAAKWLHGKHGVFTMADVLGI
ncbi:MAG: 4-hydroxy-tetrahydrodipicolinate reductase [Bacteroidota bacterium]